MAQLGAAADQLAAMTGPLEQMMRSIGGAMFGTQVGQAVGALAGEVVGSTDVGLPLAPAGTAALLPANVTAFGAGLEVPADQVRLYLALREAAHHRLFAHVPWLRAHLLDAVTAYARGISVDTSRLEEAMGGIDPTDPESLQRALDRRACSSPRTPLSRRRHSARLETALALVEGWVDEVVDAAAPAGCRPRRRCGRPSAGAGPAVDRRSRHSRLSWVSSCGRDGCARRPRCGTRVARARGHRRPGSGLGAPRPAAEAPRTSTTPPAFASRRLGAPGPVRPGRHRGAPEQPAAPGRDRA